MDSTGIWSVIDRQRAALCDLLESLTEEQWRQPSLCAGWTVRDVAAHLTFAQATVAELVGPTIRSGFRSSVMIHRTAVECPLGRDEILANIRGFIGTQRRVFFLSEKEPLIDILVHGQDIAIPLDIEHPVPLDATTVALERVLQLNHRPWMRLRQPLRGVRLVATDTDWSWGDGEIIEGPIRWLLMHAAGREIAAQHLRVSS